MGCGAFSIYPISDAPTGLTISRHALGRIKKLGALYDATTDRFCGTTIFPKRFPLEHQAEIHRTGNTQSESRYVKVRSLQEKFDELNVTGELQLSVLAGMLGLPGECGSECKIGAFVKYINQEKKSFTSKESIQIYNVKTKTHQLEIDPDKKRFIPLRRMIDLGATHAVTEIEWGATCVVSVTEQKYEVEKKKEVQGGIFGGLNWILGKLSGSNTEVETEEITDTTIKIFADALLPGPVPQTWEEAQDMMRKLSQQITKSNEGKGKPITYVMTPLSCLDWRKPLQPFKTFTSVGEVRITNVVRLFDHMTELRQKVHDRIKHDDSGRERRREADLRVYKASVKDEFARLLKNVRSGKENAKCLDAFCDKHRQTAEQIFNE